MNLNTAIILSETYLRNPLSNLKPSEREAIKLGIEALKRTLILRSNPNYNRAAPLPGETKGKKNETT